MSHHHIAQMNIGRMKGPLDSSVMADFKLLLDAVNALADASPGFVWRLKTEDGDTTAIRAFDDDLVIVNMSVWAGLEALRAYTYHSSHIYVLKRRRDWFDRMGEASNVLWWVQVGHLPTVAEGKARLEHLRQHGDTAHAFSFARPFPSPDESPSTDLTHLRDSCPA